MVRNATIMDHNPSVSVPVLSEHKTDMHPNVSIVTRFLTRTCRAAIRRATIVSESATHTDKPYTMNGLSRGFGRGTKNLKITYLIMRNECRETSD